MLASERSHTCLQLVGAVMPRRDHRERSRRDIDRCAGRGCPRSTGKRSEISSSRMETFHSGLSRCIFPSQSRPYIQYFKYPGFQPQHEWARIFRPGQWIQWKQNEMPPFTSGNGPKNYSAINSSPCPLWHHGGHFAWYYREWITFGWQSLNPPSFAPPRLRHQTPPLNFPDPDPEDVPDGPWRDPSPPPDLTSDAWLNEP